MIRHHRDISYTVVVPVYNKAPHLARCLDSILQQQRQDLEVIAVNDASTDSSLTVLEDYQHNLPIRIFSRDQPGPGGYAARNLAIANARSEWIAFLDADDTWEKGYLTELDALRRRFPEADIIGTGYRIIDPETQHDHRFTRLNRSGDQRWISLNNFIDSYLNRGGCFQTSATAARRSTLLAAGGFPEKTARQGGDVDTWLRCMLVGTGGAWSPSVKMRYHRDAVNQVTANPDNLRQPHPVATTAASYAQALHDRQQKRLLRRLGNKKGLKRARDAAAAGLYDYILVAELNRFDAVYWLHRALLPVKNIVAKGHRFV
ncbi:glycosyltransferase family 2 protein [Halorhodospira halophila]|uniref:Glycosyl transferase, family 2 n=1 Tax=Halorhodospira halophila (strain DSM 244 / SL1) TaxID=349124 RepID=A1WV62_HALHL|nr:glycosyltransferase family 2 protein [Halorhodospira halophila]ABM61574.1 glycosyl transferase, family 2 [Halorhodospira halophila SL1]MBK1728818.1 hypothetical protein [Halorhodospira halophila]